MSKYGIILKKARKYVYIAQCGAKRSTEVRSVRGVPLDWVEDECPLELEPGLVVSLPDWQPAQVPGGSGGGTRPLIHEVMELEKTWKVVEDQDMEDAPQAAKAREYLQDAVEAEQLAQDIVEDYYSLKEGESDFETVPEIAEEHGCSERHLYRVLKARVPEEDRLIPERVKGEEQDQEEEMEVAA